MPLYITKQPKDISISNSKFVLLILAFYSNHQPVICEGYMLFDPSYYITPHPFHCRPFMPALLLRRGHGVDFLGNPAQQVIVPIYLHLNNRCLLHRPRVRLYLAGPVVYTWTGYRFYPSMDRCWVPP